MEEGEEMVANAVAAPIQYKPKPSLRLLSEQAATPKGSKEEWYYKEYLFLRGRTLRSVHAEHVSADEWTSGDPTGDRLEAFVPGLGRIVYHAFLEGVSCRISPE